MSRARLGQLVRRQAKGWAGSARPGGTCLLWLMIWSSSEFIPSLSLSVCLSEPTILGLSVAEEQLQSPFRLAFLRSASRGGGLEVALARFASAQSLRGPDGGCACVQPGRLRDCPFSSSRCAWFGRSGGGRIEGQV